MAKPLFELVSLNLTELGNRMGTERIYSNWRKFFTSVDKAKSCAESYSDEEIVWKDYGTEIRSQDLDDCQYIIKEVEIEDG